MGTGLRTAFLISVFVLASAGFAFAQTTTAIVPGATVEGTTPAAPVKPLDIQDTDYPLESLLANEEGKIQLNLIVNARGQVTAARVLTPTKLTRLEQQATNIARTRWQFTPAMRDGEGVAAQVNVDVEWKLPLRPADELMSQMMGFSVVGKSIEEPKAVPATRKVLASDYPIASLRISEQGEAMLRVQVLEDGKIGSVETVESSGHRRLDESATAMIKNRWLYEPGTVDGKAAQMYTDVTVIFQLDGNTVPYCHGRPVLGSSVRMASGGSGDTIDVSQWVQLSREGKVDDVVVRTDRGWMHFQESFVAVFAQSPGLMATARLIRQKPCWFKGDVKVPGK